MDGPWTSRNTIIVMTSNADRGLSLELTSGACDLVAAEGYDPQFGARPLKRVIQQRIENELASRILAGAFEPGDTIEGDADGHRLVFRKAGRSAVGA